MVPSAALQMKCVTLTLTLPLTLKVPSAALQTRHVALALSLKAVLASRCDGRAPTLLPKYAYTSTHLSASSNAEQVLTVIIHLASFVHQ
jgi:hypothetical protein